MNNYVRPSRSAQKWSEQKEKFLQQFTDLTENDLNFETGRKHEMIERVSVKLGKSVVEMEHIFQDL